MGHVLGIKCWGRQRAWRSAALAFSCPLLLGFRLAGATTATPTQTPVPCVESLVPAGPAQCCAFCEPANTCVPAAGGSGCLQVHAPESCCWEARGGYPISVTDGHNGCGDGQVCYDVAPYYGDIGQVSDLRVNQQVFRIGQARGGTPTNTPTPTGTPDAAGRPDLLVSYAYISIPGFEGGCVSGGPTSLNLFVCIANQGNAPAGRFDVSVNERFYARVDGINPGATVCALGNYTYPDETRVVLDTSNQVDESDESNNTWTQFVAIPTLPATCTPTPTGTLPTPTGTVTPTPTSPTPTTGTPTATSTRTACPGDCNNDGRVTVNELVLGVNIVLGRATISSCLAYPLCDTGRVCVSVLVDVVGKALHGCS